MWEALREAVDEEMEKDPYVCVFGIPLQFVITQHTPEHVSQDLTSSLFLGAVVHVVVLHSSCCTGEDVGHYGGSYKVTYDLHKKYGDFRLLDTPICGKSLCSATLPEDLCHL